MSSLHERCTFLQGNGFYALFTVAILLNPLALWAQAYVAWTAPSVEGVSVLTFSLMLLLQVVTVGYAIRQKDPSIFFVMVAGALASITTLTALAIR